MASLHELQMAFAEAVLDDAPEGLPEGLLAGGRPPGEGFGLYRSSVFGNYRKALRAVYPVVERLVGERFFAYAADAYVRVHPSRCGDLNRFGSRFAEFLRGFPAASGLAYLPDAARLEWAIEAVFSAQDPDPAALLPLARIAEVDYPGLKFRLAAHCRLIDSPWPVDRLWQLNQPGVVWDEEFDIAAGGVSLLVCRSGFEVELRRLGAAERALLDSLAGGSALGPACEGVLEIEPSAPIASMLHGFLATAALQVLPPERDRPGPSR
ncbi:MAG: putative DNA-binding domain-containing protein [Rhodocyclaceae bacterium]|nr:putative DNA-binding domain-containing protein [Rhodocyclaceae bacterium]